MLAAADEGLKEHEETNEKSIKKKSAYAALPS